MIVKNCYSTLKSQDITVILTAQIIDSLDTQDSKSHCAILLYTK